MEDPVSNETKLVHESDAVKDARDWIKVNGKPGLVYSILNRVEVGIAVESVTQRKTVSGTAFLTRSRRANG
jgi:hypothetical protein